MDPDRSNVREVVVPCSTDRPSIPTVRTVTRTRARNHPTHLALARKVLRSAGDAGTER